VVGQVLDLKIIQYNQDTQRISLGLKQLQQNPWESIKVNILGTKNIADISIKYNVEKFLMISTDKAVNPTNVMGASKRVSEIYINNLNKQSDTQFITTRFGNVLGSSGSVIPTFIKQIKLVYVDLPITRGRLLWHLDAIIIIIV
jgi:FlaA1/EpsC-like NDP-sugar epimerase